MIRWVFPSRPVASAVSSSGGVQEVSITVEGRYSPDVIEVKRGKTVRLNFFRDEENSCSEELLLPESTIQRDLPAFRTTLIDLLLQQPGRFGSTCGLGKLHGSLLLK